MWNKPFKTNTSSSLIPFFIILFFILLLLFIILPVSELFVKSVRDKAGNFIALDNFILYFSNEHLYTSFWNSIYISFMTVLITVPTALIFAKALAQSNIYGKSIFRIIGLSPLFAPTMMHGIALYLLFGNQGMITKALDLNFTLYGANGIIISEFLYTFPHALLILIAAFSNIDNRLYEAGESLSATSLQKFFYITLPHIKYGLYGASLLCFTLSFTDFGAPKIVGGNFTVLAVDIYDKVAGQQNFEMGAVISVIITLPLAIAFVLDRYIQRQQDKVNLSNSIPFKIKSRSKMDLFFLLFSILISIIIIFIFATIIFASLMELWPKNLSLTWKHFDFTNPGSFGLDPLFNSIIVSFITAVLGVTITFLSAYFIERFKELKFIRKLTYFMSLLPMALPGMVLGIAYIFFYNKAVIEIPVLNISFENPFNIIYNTLFILVLVNIIHFYSVSFIYANTLLKKLDKEFEPTTQSLAVPFYYTFFRVIFPLSFPVIIEMAAYYFINSMVTISAVIYLFPAWFKLASISIIHLEEAGDIHAASALTIVIVTINFIVYLLSKFILSKFKKY